MKQTTRVCNLLYLFALVAICNPGNAEMTNKIIGEFILIEPEIHDATGPIEPADLSKATLTISYETTDEDGELETLTLYQGAYQEEFSTVIQLLEPTEVTISLNATEESEPMRINTVIGNGTDVHFAYVDRPGTDEFLLVGSSNQVINPKTQFSISGDLSFLDIDLTNTTTVFARASFVNADGERQSKQWGPVLVRDNTFLIEGDVDRPILVSLWVNAGREYFTSTQLILEPLADLKVKKLGDQIREISVTGNAGYHALMIDSWQQSDEYISLVNAWTSAFERSQNASVSEDAKDEMNNDADAESDEVVAESDKDSGETDETEENSELVHSIAPAEGCEEAVAQKAEPASIQGDEATLDDLPLSYTLRREAAKLKVEKLQDIAKNNKDANAQLLAMQMGAFDPYENADEAITVWQSLAGKFDDEFVATYIRPDLDRVELIKTRLDNDAALVPGQKVPEFTLADFDGEDISVYDLLGEKDMVLIDFWASWCGPCIDLFPDLKKLYAAYSDEKFDIVGVSVDDNREDWSGGVEDHALPWIQLGELKDADNGSPVAKSYGVNYIPTTFLVDSQGCIYRKNIDPNELKSFLIDRYGTDESLEEPELETDETPDVSG